MKRILITYLDDKTEEISAMPGRELRLWYEGPFVKVVEATIGKYGDDLLKVLSAHTLKSVEVD